MIRACLNKDITVQGYVLVMYHPIDLNVEEVSNVEFQPEVMDSLRTQREAIKKKASLNIHAAQLRQKAAYDKRHTSEDPPIGALVYIKNTRRIHRIDSKLEPQWTDHTA